MLKVILEIDHGKPYYIINDPSSGKSMYLSINHIKYLISFPLSQEENVWKDGCCKTRHQESILDLIRKNKFGGKYSGKLSLIAECDTFAEAYHIVELHLLLEY